ncbi:hypothetical protein [Pseudarthrobacter enclensis]|uniref:hypothetical protein n=1 Tax=Pseudarthrobacter enclensis TaxID=993070 RepID=UPI00130DB81D|nr:hypothetical protein [Pseudarthrobacter enclensis]
MKALIPLDINGVLNPKLVRAGDDTDPLSVLNKDSHGRHGCARDGTDNHCMR